MIEVQMLLKNEDATLENIVTMASLIAKTFPETRFDISGCAKTGTESDSFHVTYCIKYEKKRFVVSYIDGTIPFIDSCHLDDIDNFLKSFCERYKNGTL